MPVALACRSPASLTRVDGVNRRPATPGAGLSAHPRRQRSTRPNATLADAAGPKPAVLLLPGFLFSSRQYDGMAANLRARGFATAVPAVSRTDWVPVIRGADFGWYLQRADAALADLHSRHGQVALVGHSAGGWIARILLGNERYQGVRYGRSGWVHTLLTLGTPHGSAEAYPFGRAEEVLAGPSLGQAPPPVRGSSLKFANHFYPAAGSLGGVRVVCACGNAIRGRHFWPGGGGGGGGGAVSGGSGAGGIQHSRWDQYFAYVSYKANCLRGDVDGDGVTPLCIASLPGAEQLVLPGVWHSPRRKVGQLWYGDAPVLERWAQYLLHPQASAVNRP